MYENNDTSAETNPIIRIKNAERLSILKLNDKKGVFVPTPKLRFMLFKKVILYNIINVKEALEIREKVFDSVFDNFGFLYVISEDKAPTRYSNIDIINAKTNWFAAM